MDQVLSVKTLNEQGELENKQTGRSVENQGSAPFFCSVPCSIPNTTVYIDQVMLLALAGLGKEQKKCVCRFDCKATNTVMP